MIMPLLAKKRYRLSLQILLGLLSFLTLVWAAYQVWLRQIHIVIPQQVYRSAQLSPTRLAHYIKNKGIKSVLNLRGTQANEAWYQQEVAVTEKMGATHYDLSLSSHQLPTKQDLRTLVYLLNHAPKPILVHCLGGADRSGLASAISIILAQAPLSTSTEQLSMTHLVLSPHSIGKLVFPYYQAWLQQQRLPHNRDNFLRWVYSDQLFKKNPP